MCIRSLCKLLHGTISHQKYILQMGCSGQRREEKKHPKRIDQIEDLNIITANTRRGSKEQKVNEQMSAQEKKRKRRVGEQANW